MPSEDARFGLDLDDAVQKVMAAKISRRQFAKRAIQLGMSAGAIAAVLEACSTGTSTGAPTTGATNAPATIAPATQSGGGTTAAPASAGTGAYDPMRYKGSTVHILVDAGETDEKGLQDKAADIKDKFGITITVDTLALGPLIAKTDEVLKAATSPYDIISVVAIQVPVWIAAGQFLRLNDWIADPSRTPADYDFADFPKPSAANLNWDATNQTYSADSDIQLIPGIHSGSVLAFYRKDLLAKAGLQIPKTWDEWMAAAAAMNNPPTVYGCSMVAANDFSLTSVDWWHRFENIGGQLFAGSLKDKTYKPNVNSPEGIRALQMMIDALKYASPNVTTYGFAESVDNMSSGKTAQMVLWSTIAGAVFDPTSSKVHDQIVASTVPTNLSGGKPIAFLGGWGVGIPKNAGNKDAAWQVMTYITSREFDKYQVLTYESDANRTSTFKDPAVIAKIPSAPIALDATLNGKIFEGAYTPDYVAMLTVSNAEFNLALLGKQTAADACTHVQTAWEDIGHKTGWLKA